MSGYGKPLVFDLKGGRIVPKWRIHLFSSESLVNCAAEVCGYPTMVAISDRIFFLLI